MRKPVEIRAHKVTKDDAKKALKNIAPQPQEGLAEEQVIGELAKWLWSFDAALSTADETFRNMVWEGVEENIKDFWAYRVKTLIPKLHSLGILFPQEVNERLNKLTFELGEIARKGSEQEVEEARREIGVWLGEICGGIELTKGEGITLPVGFAFRRIPLGDLDALERGELPEALKGGA